jgi:hypothetical protein
MLPFFLPIISLKAGMVFSSLFWLTICIRQQWWEKRKDPLMDLLVSFRSSHHHSFILWSCVWLWCLFC